MSLLIPSIHPFELPNDALTEYKGDYFYRAHSGNLYQLRATPTRLEIIHLEYPTRSMRIESTKQD